MQSAAVRIIKSFPNPTAMDYTEDLWYRQHHDSIVIINSFSKDIWFPSHWSPLSVKCAFGGHEYYHFGKATLAAGNGNFLIVNEGSVYESSIRHEQLVESFTLNFTPQNIKDICHSTGSAIRQLDNPFSGEIATMRFTEKMYSHHASAGPVLMAIRDLVKTQPNNHSLITETCYVLLENMVLLQQQTAAEIDNVRAVKPSTRAEMYKRLTLARDYMHSCYAEPITLHDLSRICFLNPCYLLRAFKQHYAITPHRYLTQRRLAEARKLLLETDIPVTDLAGKCGFQDSGSFSKLFKKYYSLSPEHFRSKNR